MPLALVIRDGREKRIPSSEIVPGDLILLREGDRIGADARLITSVSLQIDESLLTGESVPVLKNVGDSAYTGSLVVRGHGSAEVLATGTATQLGKIGKSLTEIPDEKTTLQKNVARIVKVIGLAALATVIAVFALYGTTRGNWLEAGLAGISVAMALIPEEFPVILTIFLALGAWRMARAKVVARKPAAIEALGAITVLCVDKTGTLTENRMEIAEIHTEERIWRNTEIPDENIAEAIRIAALATPKSAYDPMDIAFQKLAKTTQMESLIEFKSISEKPLTKENLFYTHIWQDSKSLEKLYAVKGAPEHIAKLCNFDHAQYQNFAEKVKTEAARGYRTIGIAKSSDGQNYTFLGLALLSDPIRDGVP